MHKVSANYTLPTVLNTLQPAITNGLRKALSPRATTAPTTATTSSSSADGGLGTTFLNLLSTELQNQDPTAPVDSTAMVGQMISLNQLDQLISINQTLTASGGTAGSPPSTPAVGNTELNSVNGGVATALPPSVAAAAANQLPFDPNTMMPLNSANANAVAASINSSINAASMGSSTTSNNNSGGK
jgi:flagellar basal-body rod modification protein FlgD